MLQFDRGVLVKALGAALLLGEMATVGCSPPRGPVDRHIVPQELTRASLEDFDVVPLLDVDLHTAIDTRRAVDIEFAKAPDEHGHPRWFFHAFDAKSLDFVVARYVPTPSGNVRYVAVRRLRVKRSGYAERALGVAEVVRKVEARAHGIKTGMSRSQVEGVAGRPESWVPREDRGSFDLLYPDFCVSFVSGKVTRILPRHRCAF